MALGSLLCLGCSGPAIRKDSHLLRVWTEGKSVLLQQNGRVLTCAFRKGMHTPEEFQMMEQTLLSVCQYLYRRPGVWSVYPSYVERIDDPPRNADIPAHVIARWAEIILEDAFPYEFPPVYTLALGELLYPVYPEDRLVFCEYRFSRVAIRAIIRTLSEVPPTNAKTRRIAEDAVVDALSSRLGKRSLNELYENEHASDIMYDLIFAARDMKLVKALPVRYRIEKRSESTVIFGGFSSTARSAAERIRSER